MRLSLLKAAHAQMDGTAYRKSGYLARTLREMWEMNGSYRVILPGPKPASRSCIEKAVEFPTSPHQVPGEMWGTRIRGTWTSKMASGKKLIWASLIRLLPNHLLPGKNHA
jgi:hypothetical protein